MTKKASTSKRRLRAFLGSIKASQTTTTKAQAYETAKCAALDDLKVKSGHYEVVRDVVDDKVVVKRISAQEDPFCNDFIVIFPYHKVIWDLRKPVALQCTYLRALVRTPMDASYHVDDNGRHYVVVADEKAPVEELHPSAFTVAGLVLVFGATVEYRYYDKYKLSELCAEGSRALYSMRLGHVDRCNTFKEVRFTLFCFNSFLGSIVPPVCAPPARQRRRH